MDVTAVLAAHDAQVRRSTVVPAGFVAEDLGDVVRVTAPPGSDSCRVEFTRLDDSTVDATIAAQLRHFAGRTFEWKTYGRDAPPDLGDRLAAAGFVAGDPEAFVVGEVADVLAATRGHDVVEGVHIREATEADLPALGALTEVVWGRAEIGMLREVFAERAAAPDTVGFFVAVAEERVVCHGRVALPAGVDFASLWGGSTHPAYRGRGIYRALVRRRALLAAERGHRWLQVDASPASRPILERLGLRALDITTPYLWDPAGGR